MRGVKSHIRNNTPMEEPLLKIEVKGILFKLREG
jgi:hypothetical protein